MYHYYYEHYYTYMHILCIMLTIKGVIKEGRERGSELPGRY